MSLLGKLDLDVRTSRKFRPCQHGARASAQLAGACLLSERSSPSSSWPMRCRPALPVRCGPDCLLSR